MAKTNYIVLFLFCITLVACFEEGEIFIPANTVGPFEELNEIANNKSSAHKLNNQEHYTLTTTYKSVIEIESGIFFQQSEDNDIDYELYIVEMRSYLDFILQNVDHQSELGLTNTVYSFYYSAEANGKILTIDESKFIRVKIPTNKLEGELFLGKGEIDEVGELSWHYYDNSLNSRIRYTNWEVIDENGGISKEEGYELLVDNPGWYSIVTKTNKLTEEKDICLNLNSSYNPDNTLAYAILNGEGYLSKFRIGLDGNAFCISDLPIPSDLEEIKILTISYLEDESYHLFLEEYDTELISSEYNIIPLPVSKNELISVLENL